MPPPQLIILDLDIPNEYTNINKRLRLSVIQEQIVASLSRFATTRRKAWRLAFVVYGEKSRPVRGARAARQSRAPRQHARTKCAYLLGVFFCSPPPALNRSINIPQAYDGSLRVAVNLHVNVFGAKLRLMRVLDSKDHGPVTNVPT
ncbi:unnamed protein product [Chrysodeixis includens]|uniref:Uncharacterized protein n=1 Tax=Chrysodeixis includens TaxID=689277 RepID=A0A9N8L6D6_CHRIL|nr:unnamed protein product [Chrysodeixis includens]